MNRAPTSTDPAGDRPSGRRRLTRVVALVIVGLGIAAALAAPACGGAARSGTAAPGPLPAPAATAVRIRTFMFRPEPVRIAAGTTIEWTNEDEILHTVTSGSRTYDDRGLPQAVTAGPPGFDFRLDGAGASASFTFGETGTFPYLCRIHPGMDARVIVG